MDIKCMIISKKVIPLSEIKGYSTIREKLEDKTHSLQFLPISLEELVKNKNFIYKNKKLKTSYIVDIIHNLILKYYFKKENKFNLMSTILKENMDSYIITIWIG